MSKISISYRRQDSPAMARLICDRLSARYGPDSVFMDVESISAGEDFRKHIASALQESDVLIVVVGQKWLGQRTRGHTTIADDSDWIRIEVETALKRNIKVIPALINGARMPRKDQLPESLQDFAFRQALTVDAGAYFDDHMEKLISTIDETLKSALESRAKQQALPETVPAEVPPPKPVTLLDTPGSQEATSQSVTRPQRDDGSSASGADSRERQFAENPRFPGRETWSKSANAILAPLRRPKFALAAVAGVMALLLIGSAVYWYAPVRDLVKSVSVNAQKTATSSPSVASKSAPANKTATIDNSVTSKPLSANKSAAIEKSGVSKPPSANQPGSSSSPDLAKLSVCGMAGSAQTNAKAVGGEASKIIIRPDLSAAASVRDVAFSPDGRRFATASDDGYVRLWDASSFRLIGVVPNPAAIYSLDFWKDGQKLAFAGWNGIVGIWDFARNTVTPLQTERNGKAHNQYGVAFAPDASLRYVASAGESGLVWIWNVDPVRFNRTKPDPVEQDAATVRSLSFAPKFSGEFVTLDLAGKLKFYRADRIVDQYDAFDRTGLRIAYSPDGTLVAAAGRDSGLNNLKIYRATASALLPVQTLKGYGDYITSVAWSGDGKRLVSGGGGKDPTVRVWDLANGRNIRLGDHGYDVEAVGFLPKTNHVVSVSEDKTIKIWDATTARQLLTIIPYGGSDFLAYSPDGCFTGSKGIEQRARFNYKDGSSGREFAINTVDVEKLYLKNGFTTLTSAVAPNADANTKVTIPTRALPPSNEKRARDFVLALQVRWSRPNAEALAGIDDLYEQDVMYDGKIRKKDEVIRDKRDFLQRWSEREYKPREPVSVSCAGQICSVEGQVDFRAVNPHDRIVSEGLAEFQYKLAMSGSDIRILSEVGKTVYRNRTPLPRVNAAQ